MPKSNIRTPLNGPESATGSSEQKRSPDSAAPEGEPFEVAAIRKEIRTFLDTLDANGNRIGGIKYGVYAFYDYDDEPIYIGRTFEGFGNRLGRHLTGRRSDAVAKNVLDPFEVATVCVWPLELGHLAENEMKKELNRAEYTLYLKVVEDSLFKAVLNEEVPRKANLITLPRSYSRRIIPEDIFPQRKHPDIRIARRANTIAALARVISERKVGGRLRKILLTQAQRLEHLAKTRLADFAGASEEQDKSLKKED